MQLVVTASTQSNQIQLAIGSKVRAKPNVVNLKLFPSAAVLTSPVVCKFVSIEAAAGIRFRKC
jgi:hypothetical protein